MRLRIASVLLGMFFLASGCQLHPPYGILNDNTTFIPPLSKLTHRNNLPPAEMLMEPGPGVGGPGPGIISPVSFNGPPGPCGPGGGPMGPMGPGCGPGCGPGGMGPGGMMPGGMGGMGGMITSQVAFSSPDGMEVTWDIGGMGAFDSEPLIVPARYNFPIASLYRLKLTNIPGRPGVELYPTLEIGPPTPRSEAYLAHNAIPAQFTEEDFDQVLSGNFVTKVVYLPDPEFQELAIAGVETLVSTRLDPGFDPIVEADRRGAILAIIRVGNKDLEAAGGEAEFAGMGGAGGYCGAMCGPGGSPCIPGITGAMPAGTPAEFIAGMTAPEYGMPTSGTPIGLPGPAHIPLGVPAGLQKHVIANHTKMHIPSPVRKFKIDVREKPGFSYPEPVKHVKITEHKHMPPVLFHQPIGDKHDFDYDVPDATDCQ